LSILKSCLPSSTETIITHPVHTVGTMQENSAMQIIWEATTLSHFPWTTLQQQPWTILHLAALPQPFSPSTRTQRSFMQRAFLPHLLQAFLPSWILSIPASCCMQSHPLPRLQAKPLFMHIAVPTRALSKCVWCTAPPSPTFPERQERRAFG